MTPCKKLQRLAALGLAAAFAFMGTAATAAPAAKVIRVLSAKDADAASPRAAIWSKAPVAHVALQPAFAGHPSIVGTPATDKLAAHPAFPIRNAKTAPKWKRLAYQASFPNPKSRQTKPSRKLELPS